MRWKAEGGNGYKVGEKEKEKKRKKIIKKKKEGEGKGMRRSPPLEKIDFMWTKLWRNFVGNDTNRYFPMQMPR